MSGAPDVSVVIPSRDRHERLPATLLCAAEQLGVDCEVIVVDDGSRRPLEGHVVAPNARVLRNDVSRGVAGARNAGLEAARGKWVAFLDDDDLWAPGRLRELLDRFQRAGASWGFTGGLAIDGAGRPIFQPRLITDPDALGRALFRYNAVPITCSNLVARAELAQSLGGFDTDLDHLADWDFALRLSRAGRPAVVPEPLLAYVLHGGNMQQSEAGLDDELDRFAAKHRRAAEEAGEAVDRVAWLNWRIRARRLGGDRRGAARLLRRRAALANRPSDHMRAAVLLLAGERAMGAGRRVTWSRPPQAPTWLASAVAPAPEALARVWREARLASPPS